MTKAKPKPSLPDLTAPCFLGIDPGLSGGIAIVGEGVWTSAMPTTKAARKRQYDLDAIRAILKAVPIAYGVIEYVDAAPMHGRRQGTAGMFNFGRGYGAILGLLVGLEIPYEPVAPRAWKKAILSGTAKDKEAAIAYAKTFYPEANLRASRLARTDSDGIADALCLATLAKAKYTASPEFRIEMEING